MASTLMASPPQTNPENAIPTSTPRDDPSVSSIWQNVAFRRLWTGETISLFGTEVTVLALPLTAILVLKATAFEVGLLDALSWLPYLLFSLALGVWVDQRRRRPLILFANFARSGLLVLIPVAWLGHILSFPLLYIVAFCAGVLSVVFNLAYQSYVPILLAQAHILSGNSKLQLSASSAKIAGPGIAGLLIQAISAPAAIIIDALSYLFAGLSVMRISTPEPLPAKTQQRQPLWQDIRDGLDYTFHHPHLRAMTGMASTYNLAEQILLTLWILFASQHRITPTWLGVILAVGSGGALVGSVVAGQLLRRVGITIAMRCAIVTSAIGLLGIPLASGSQMSMSLILALAFGINGAGLAALNIFLRSIRQQTVPAAMMGRVLASYTCFSMGAVPIGALLAGSISSIIGIRWTLIMGAIVALFAIPWIWNLVVPTTMSVPMAKSAPKLPMKRSGNPVRIQRRVIRPLPRSRPWRKSRRHRRRSGNK